MFDNITGVYFIIATLGFTAFSLQLNPIVVVTLCGILAGLYKVALTQYVETSPDKWLLVMHDGKAIQQTIGGSRLLMPG
jgi:hypothetical protein